MRLDASPPPERLACRGRRLERLSCADPIATRQGAADKPGNKDRIGEFCPMQFSLERLFRRETGSDLLELPEESLAGLYGHWNLRGGICGLVGH
jgi:hypothetical protein